MAGRGEWLLEEDAAPAGSTQTRQRRGVREVRADDGRDWALWMRQSSGQSARVNEVVNSGIPRARRVGVTPSMRRELSEVEGQKQVEEMVTSSVVDRESKESPVSARPQNKDLCVRCARTVASFLEARLGSSVGSVCSLRDLLRTHKLVPFGVPLTPQRPPRD